MTVSLKSKPQTFLLYQMLDSLKSCYPKFDKFLRHVLFSLQEKYVYKQENYKAHKFSFCTLIWCMQLNLLQKPFFYLIAIRNGLHIKQVGWLLIWLGIFKMGLV